MAQTLAAICRLLRVMKNRLLLPSLVAAAFLFALPAAAKELLPRPAGIEANVQFWIRIYSEVGSDSGLIHDSRDLGIVYEKIHVPASQSRRARDRQTKRARERAKAVLGRLARGKRSGLTKDEARILALFPEGVSNATLKQAARQVRFQRGMADRFRAGLIRSGRWRDYIEDTFLDAGLPVELAALPHVESSYNPKAYSHVGAAGLWQFMRGTGRRFMRVDHVVDERLDPYRATVAAARLLEANYQVTKSWPLAITAYNHGAAGMRRAVRKLGTDDIATIVHKYRSRTFGFASRNFYSEFLAALEVDRNAERYFGKLVPEAPIAYQTTPLPFFTTASALRKALGVSEETLREANPSLRPMVWSGEKRVPKNFTLRIPRSSLSDPLTSKIAGIPEPARYASQTRDRSVRVAPGRHRPSGTSSPMLSALPVQRPRGLPGSRMQVQSAGRGFPAAHRRWRDLDQLRELRHRRSALLAQVGDHLARGYKSGGGGGEIPRRGAPAGGGRRRRRSIRERLLDLLRWRRRVGRRRGAERRSRLRRSGCGPRVRRLRRGRAPCRAGFETVGHRVA